MHGGGGLDHNTWFTRASDSGRDTRSAADPLNAIVKSGRLDILYAASSSVCGYLASGMLFHGHEAVTAGAQIQDRQQKTQREPSVSCCCC